VQFYTKGEDGSFAEVTQEQLEGEFKPRFERFKKTEAPKIRTEVEESIRKELTPKLTDEIKKQLDDEYKPKLEAAESKATKLEITVRQKTIAAEYGFKSDLESFLGDGTDDEMRAKADVLKSTGHAATTTTPEKTTTNQAKQGFVTKVE